MDFNKSTRNTGRLNYNDQPPPAPGAGAINITEDSKNEQKSTERIFDDITSSINEQVENQQNIVSQYDNNVGNTANYILGNSNTIDPNNPLSQARQRKLYTLCENISDLNWRNFYLTCFDTVFLKILRDNYIELTKN